MEAEDKNNLYVTLSTYRRIRDSRSESKCSRTNTSGIRVREYLLSIVVLVFTKHSQALDLCNSIFSRGFLAILHFNSLKYYSVHHLISLTSPPTEFNDPHWCIAHSPFLSARNQNGQGLLEEESSFFLLI